MITSTEFREILISRDASEIVAEYITADVETSIVKADDLNFFCQQARIFFQIDEKYQLNPIVVGSAKLGFSIMEKIEKGVLKPRYREYEAGSSDIDLAIVSPALYQKIWRGLAIFGSNQTKFPFQSSLGDYMFHGWIRPDKFPVLGHPMICSDWHTFMGRMHRSTQFKYRKLRCAIYQSKYFLDLYQSRSVIIAQAAEKEK